MEVVDFTRFTPTQKEIVLKLQLFNRLRSCRCCARHAIHKPNDIGDCDGDSEYKLDGDLNCDSECKDVAAGNLSQVSPVYKLTHSCNCACSCRHQMRWIQREFVSYISAQRVDATTMV